VMMRARCRITVIVGMGLGAPMVPKDAIHGLRFTVWSGGGL
jgi:hypothetical protein